MKRIVQFAIAVAALFGLVGWVTTVAYGASTDPVLAGVSIKPAEPPSAPGTVFFGNEHGNITPADLFYVDTALTAGNLSATLYLTNPQEITHYLRYLILEIKVYTESAAGRWEEAGLEKGNTAYLTLQNSSVKFILQGGTRYKISMGSGGYYSFPYKAGNVTHQLRFYLTVEPL